MLRACVLVAALLSAMIPAGAAEQAKTSSWDSERMRLTARPKRPSFADELRGNCAGLKVMIETRIEWLRALEVKAAQQQWPPPSFAARWERRPVGGDIARQRERIAQLNAALRTKGCQSVDVDAEPRRAAASATGAKRK